MHSLLSKLKKIPPKGWAIIGAGIVVIFLLMKRNSNSAAQMAVAGSSGDSTYTTDAMNSLSDKFNQSLAGIQGAIASNADQAQKGIDDNSAKFEKLIADSQAHNDKTLVDLTTTFGKSLDSLSSGFGQQIDLLSRDIGSIKNSQPDYGQTFQQFDSRLTDIQQSQNDLAATVSRPVNVPTSPSTSTPTPTTSGPSAIDLMKQNASQWQNANAAQRKKLEQQNQSLGKGSGLFYESNTGKWYHGDGTQAY